MTPLELYSKNERCINYVASKITHFMDERDFRQMLRMHLWKACLRWDERKSTLVHFFMTIVKRNNAIDHIRQVPVIRPHTGSTLSQCYIWTQSIRYMADPSQLANRAHAHIKREEEVQYRCEKMIEGINTLNERYQKIARMRLDGMTVQEIAQQEGVSKQRISEIMDVIRKRLLEYIESR